MEFPAATTLAVRRLMRAGGSDFARTRIRSAIRCAAFSETEAVIEGKVFFSMLNCIRIGFDAFAFGEGCG